jgi:hypothetical protein
MGKVEGILKVTQCSVQSIPRKLRVGQWDIESGGLSETAIRLNPWQPGRLLLAPATWNVPLSPTHLLPLSSKDKSP